MASATDIEQRLSRHGFQLVYTKGGCTAFKRVRPDGTPEFIQSDQVPQTAPESLDEMVTVCEGSEVIGAGENDDPVARLRDVIDVLDILGDAGDARSLTACLR